MVTGWVWVLLAASGSHPGFLAVMGCVLELWANIKTNPLSQVAFLSGCLSKRLERKLECLFIYLFEAKDFFFLFNHWKEFPKIS